MSIDIEKEWFKLLTMVQGVGAKVGLAILGVLGPEELIRAVSTSDSAIVSRAPGVGPKLAKRIASELKDKIGTVALGAALNSISSNDVIDKNADDGDVVDSSFTPWSSFPPSFA